MTRQPENRGWCFAVWILLAASGCLAWPLAATAHGQGYGFAWADDPTAPFHTPNSFYAYNDSGTPPGITRTGTGLYSVRFPGLRDLITDIITSDGNVQVTA